VPHLRDGLVVVKVAFAQKREPYPQTVAEGLKNGVFSKDNLAGQMIERR
jgi:hypothetical protein